MVPWRATYNPYLFDAHDRTLNLMAWRRSGNRRRTFYQRSKQIRAPSSVRRHPKQADINGMYALPITMRYVTDEGHPAAVADGNANYTITVQLKILTGFR